MKKLLYVKHAFHNKTKSNDFLQEIIKTGYEIEFFDYDNDKDTLKKFQELEGKEFDTVVLFQIMPPISELKKYIKMILREVAGAPQETENTFLIDDLISYLEIHYSNDITLNELAEHKYFVSAGHLSRLFKAKTGMNFSKYLMSLRMKKAEEYLENTDFDITDIASLTGYNDVSHFTQTFRKNSGMTPSEFRGKKRKQKSYKNANFAKKLH